jgi:hypothetical protein
MALNIRPDGNFEIIYAGPYTGINVQKPANLIADSDTPASNDFIFRNSELTSRWAFVPTFTTATLGQISATGFFNNVLWAAVQGHGLYTYSFGTNLWTLVAGSGGLTQPIASWRVFNNILYLTMQGQPTLSSWDGVTFTLSIATVAGGATTVGAWFLDELSQQLLMANTVESDPSTHPTRLRWSAVNLPAVWDPTVNTNAGFNDFIDVPDQITSLMMLGRVGYIFRTDGITEIDPTGNGNAPFQFNHLWASQIGVGNTPFFASAQYGLTGAFVARDNVYSIQSYQLQPIGGNARDAIMNDIALAGGANLFGVVIPHLVSGTLPTFTPGLGTTQLTSAIYLSYWLFMPNNVAGSITGTKVWVYSFEDNNWTTFNLPGSRVFGRPALGVDSFGSSVMAVPCLTLSGSSNTVAVFNAFNFNDTTQGSSHTYKIEDVFPNMVPTIRRVVLTYRNFGITPVTLTITGTNDLGANITSTTTVTLGNAIATATTMLTAFVDISFTGFRPQLTISKAAGAGPLSIVMTTIVGRVEKTTL